MNDPQRQSDEERIDEMLAQSFPASDPPSWTLGVVPAGQKPASAPREDDACTNRRERGTGDPLAPEPRSEGPGGRA